MLQWSTQGVDGGLGLRVLHFPRFAVYISVCQPGNCLKYYVPKLYQQQNPHVLQVNHTETYPPQSQLMIFDHQEDTVKKKTATKISVALHLVHHFLEVSSQHLPSIAQEMGQPIFLGVSPGTRRHQPSGLNR